MNKNKRLITTVAAMLAFVSWADTATFTMPVGVTNTVDEAIAAGRLSGVSGYQGLLAAEDLVVTGGGALKIDKDLKTGGYAGEVHVRAGTTLVLASAGALGGTEKGSFVEDGATLAVDAAGTANSLAFAGERLSFAGDGVDGLGAVQVIASGTNQRTGCWGGTVLTMTGDATVGIRGDNGGTYDFPCQSAVNSLDMGGHTLAIVGDGARQYTLPVRFKVSNPGNMVVSNRVYLSVNNAVNLGGDAANTLTIGANSCIDLYGCTVAGALKWKLVLESEQEGVLRSTSGGGIWEGPVERTGGERTYIPMISESTTDRPMLKFAGGFTTTNLVEVTNSTKKAEYTQPIVELPVSGNSFPEGLKLMATELKLGSATALPSDSGLLTLVNAPLTFSDSGADYILPATTIDNATAQTLSAASINWGGTFTKRGAGSLNVDALAAFKDLDVQAGSLSLPAVENRHWNAGLWKGTNQNYTGWTGTEPTGRTDYYSRTCYTNGIAMGPDVVMASTAVNYGKLTVITYRGYLWNRDTSSSSRVITFWCNANTLSQVYVVTTEPTEQTPGGQSTDDAKTAGIRLATGAHRIEIRVVTLNGQTGPNGKFSKDYGIMYTWGSSTCASTDPKDYLPLMDPGDGSLLTLTVPGTAEYKALEAKATAERQFAESVTVDGSLDLGGANLSALTLSGTGTVVNEPVTYATGAKLTVTDALTVRKTDLAADKHLSVTGKVVFKAGAQVTFDTARGLKNGMHVILSATEGIEGLPEVDPAAGEGLSVRLSDDGKSLVLDVCRGLIMLVK